MNFDIERTTSLDATNAAQRSERRATPARSAERRSASDGDSVMLRSLVETGLASIQDDLIRNGLMHVAFGSKPAYMLEPEAFDVLCRLAEREGLDQRYALAPFSQDYESPERLGGMLINKENMTDIVHANTEIFQDLYNEPRARGTITAIFDDATPLLTSERALGIALGYGRENAKAYSERTEPGEVSELNEQINSGLDAVLFDTDGLLQRPYPPSFHHFDEDESTILINTYVDESFKMDPPSTRTLPSFFKEILKNRDIEAVLRNLRLE